MDHYCTKGKSNWARRVNSAEFERSLVLALGQVDDRLANLVSEDLTGMPAEPVVAGRTINTPPNWYEYLEAMDRAAADFADEFAHDLRALVEKSGDFLHDRVRREQVPALPAPDPERIGAILNRLGPRAVLDDDMAGRWRELLGGSDDLFLAGSFAEADRDRLGGAFRVRTGSFDEFDASNDTIVQSGIRASLNTFLPQRTSLLLSIASRVTPARDARLNDG